MHPAIRNLIVSTFVAVALTSARANAFLNPFISNCTTITEPGSYIVTNNILATAATLQPTNFPAGGNIPSCIVIAANFVTLDLAGHVIDGSAISTPANGISSHDPSSANFALVHSGVVANFAGSGIVLIGDGHAIHDIRATNNIVGISAFGLTGGFRLSRNTVVNNKDSGISLSCPVVLVENVAAGNGDQTDASQIAMFGSNCTRQENSPAP